MGELWDEKLELFGKVRGCYRLESECVYRREVLLWIVCELCFVGFVCEGRGKVRGKFGVLDNF